MRNLIDWLLEDAPLDGPALWQAGEWFSYRQLTARVRQVSAFVRERARAEHGPPIVPILGENSFHQVSTYLGVLAAGAVAAPISPMADEPLAAVLRETKASVCFVEPRLLDRAQALGAHAVPWDLSLVDEAHATVAVDPNALAALLYTSGSTGTPRGVMLSASNFRFDAEELLTIRPLAADDRALAILPFYYCFGISLLHTHLRSRASIVLCRSEAIESAPEVMTETGVTGVIGVPSLYQTGLTPAILEARASPSLRYLMVGGGRLPDRFVLDLRKSLPHVDLYVRYGITEVTAVASFLPHTRFDTKLGSIGSGLPRAPLAVVRPDGTPIAPGSDEVGEIVVTGAHVSLGYYGDPEATARCFRGQSFHTGDLARLDADGCLFVVGREREFIKSAGHRIAPQEIEDVLHAHADVQEAAVYGEPDEARGEALVAVVAARAGRSPTTSKLRRWCASRLPASKVPDRFAWVNALPRTSRGKLARDRLREVAPARRAPEPVEAPDEVGDQTIEQRLQRIWRRALGIDAVAVSERYVDDLGGDSLSAAQIVTAARASGVRLSMSHLYGAQSISAIVEELARPVTATGERFRPRGQVPMLPQQAALFDVVNDPLRFLLLPRLYASKEPIDLRRLARTFEIVLERHDSLRVRFVAADPEWLQEVLPSSAARFVPIALDQPKRVGGPLWQEWTRAAAQIDPVAGVNLVVSPLTDPSGVCHRFGVAVSHLASDMLSMDVIEAEVASVYRSLSVGEAPAAHEEEHSVFAVMARMQEEVRRGGWDRELSYWREIVAAAGRVPGLGRPSGEGAPRTVAMSIGLGADEVKRLRALAAGRGGGLAYVAWAAVLRSLMQVRALDALVVRVTAAGRWIGRFPDLDLTNTVGLLAYDYPVVLASLRSGSALDALGSLRAQIEAVRAQGGEGLGYLALQSRDPSSSLSDENDDMRQAIGINWLGGDASRPATCFSRVRLPGRPLDECYFRSPLTLYGSADEDGLRLTMVYRADLLSEAEAARLSEGTRQILAELSLDTPRPG